MEIKLNSCCYEYDKEKSFYNRNYYRLKNYGDWFYSNYQLYLYEICHEDENCYTSTIGYFDNYKFVEIFSYVSSNSAVE